MENLDRSSLLFRALLRFRNLLDRFRLASRIAPMMELVDSIDLCRTALLVVDAQNAFAAAGSPLAEKGLDLSKMVATVPKVQAAVELARRSETTVAFSRTVRDPALTEDPASRFDVVSGVDRGETICQLGDWDAMYVNKIDPEAGEYEVLKQGYDAFHGTALDYYFRTAGIETVLICGFVTDVCVEGTARGAHERGYNVALVADACASYTEERHRTAVDFVDSYLGVVVSLAEVRDAVISD